MEFDPDRILIKINWKSEEETNKYKQSLNNIIAKDNLLWGNTGWFGEIEVITIGFRELDDISVSQWISAINNIITFLNITNIEWHSYKVAFTDKKDDQNDNNDYGYIILHKNYLIISHTNDDGTATPKIYQLGNNKKLI